MEIQQSSRARMTTVNSPGAGAAVGCCEICGVFDAADVARTPLGEPEIVEEALGLSGAGVAAGATADADDCDGVVFEG
jgi:hypothetical protein